MKTIGLFSFLIVVSAMSTACTGTMLSGHEVTLTGSPEGIAAMGDVFTGMQVISKTHPEELPKNPHSALRKVQEEQKTLRIQLMHKGDK